MNLPVPIERELLPQESFTQLLAMAPSLAKAYATRQIFRTETEARVSVLNDLHFPTPAAKYWQAVREQCVMLEQLTLLSFEWRRNELAIKRFRVLTTEDAAIDLDECLFKRAGMLTIANDRYREITMWEMLKQEQTKAATFDTDNVNTHQLVSYTTQFIKRVAHADPASMNGGELDNLLGQLRTSIRQCQELGTLDAVRFHLPVELREQLPQ